MVTSIPSPGAKLDNDGLAPNRLVKGLHQPRADHRQNADDEIEGNDDEGASLKDRDHDSTTTFGR